LKLVESGVADLVSYAAVFLANPDLPERLAAGGPFNTPDYSKAYGEITWATPITQPRYPTLRRQL
jgi:2,4-dienoyl-CoA reductase-like NADH-dependent reductase (Old Yellow Enzyme family)